MDAVHSVLNFIWTPWFRPIPIPEFQPKWTFALAKVNVSGSKYEASMEVRFNGKGGPKRIAAFITSVGEGLAPAFWTSDTMDGMGMCIAFPLVEGSQRPIDRTPAQNAEVMVHYYWRLINLCGIPHDQAQVPRIVLDFVHGHSASDARSVPLGKYLSHQALAELSAEHR